MNYAHERNFNMKRIYKSVKALSASVLAMILFYAPCVYASSNPSTGDDGKYLLWLGLLIIFAVAIVRIIMLSKKKK